jgi:thymidylate synthase (FAD)
MKIVEANATIIDCPNPENTEKWENEIDSIASAARVSRGGGCHTAAENEELVRKLVKKQHFSALEFGSITVLFIVDRAIANELTRHRHISCVQESTRYVSYTDGIPVIKPSDISPNTKMYDLWESAVLACEHAYLEAVRYGLDPEYARSMLPHCLAARLIVKANFREWRHILKLRTDKAAHPDMRKVMSKLAAQCAKKCPAVFGDIV